MAEIAPPSGFLGPSGGFFPRVNVPVTGGPVGLVSWCSVAASPVGVLVRPAGTIAFHTNGVDAWFNVDGTANGWVPFSALASFGQGIGPISLGAPASSFDLAIPGGCDANGGFRLLIWGQSVNANPSIVNLRVNSSTVNLARTGHYATPAGLPTPLGIADSELGRYNSFNPIAGTVWFADIDCPVARSGVYRNLNYSFGAFENPTTLAWVVSWFQRTWLSVANITHVGVEVTVPNDMAATTRICLLRYPVL